VSDPDLASAQEETMPPMPITMEARRTRLEDIFVRDLMTPNPAPSVTGSPFAKPLRFWRTWGLVRPSS
jgi:hypothetical protein